MNNKHLIKKITEIRRKAGYEPNAWFEAQLESLILSEKNDLINKFSEIIGKEKEVSGCNCNQCREKDNKDVYVRNQLRTELRVKLSQLTEEEME